MVSDADGDADPDEVDDTRLGEPEEIDEVLTVVVAVVLAAVEVTELDAATPFAIVENVVHCEELGAGCAGGVDGSPWWNVEEP